MRIGDAPLVGASGRPFPVFRAMELIGVVDLEHVAGVFDGEFLRSGEIGEYVVASAVTARLSL